MMNYKKLLLLSAICILALMPALQCSLSSKSVQTAGSDQHAQAATQSDKPAFAIGKQQIDETPQQAEQKTDGPGSGQPAIAIDAAIFDAGEVMEGDIVTHAFTVKNTGAGLLNISAVKPG